MIIVRTPTICLTTTLQQSLKRIPFECKLLRALKYEAPKGISYLYLPHIKASLLHSFDDKPAYVIGHPSNGGVTNHWYYANKKHRDNDKPAFMFQSSDSSTIYIYKWYKNGKLHREEGPAIIRSSGPQYYHEYYKNGIMIRTKTRLL